MQTIILTIASNYSNICPSCLKCTVEIALSNAHKGREYKIVVLEDVSAI